MAHFTPLSAALGGALIGLSAALMLLLIGRVAGISGIFGGLISASDGDRGWRVAFVAGLILAPVSAMLLGQNFAPQLAQSWPVMIAAGLLTGFGTRLGGGCTSGHGVCGVARLSPRSLAATAIFFVTAIVVVFLRRHVIGA